MSKRTKADARLASSTQLGGLEAVFAHAAQAVDTHYEVFSAQTARAQGLADRGRTAEAVVYARAAADYASTNHPGVYSSPDLERLLQDAGRELVRPVKTESVARSQDSGRGLHVLHVLSAAYDIGGHTRFVWRWIERDRGRTHSVVLTHQRNLTPPEPLCRAASQSGGRLYRLDDRPSGLSQRAGRLAALSREVDLVVLHTHPFDVIPLLAFADATATPVILLNQADHVFWLGRGVARLVVNFRDSGNAFSTRRRGVPEEQLALLPIPLQKATRTLPKAAAKAELGLSADKKLIVSVASAYKYAPLSTLDFPHVFAGLARERTDLEVIVVGPDADARWRAAEEASGGRVRAVGRKADLSLFHQAADLYVDSFPFGSSTSLLEAGLYGVPVLSLNPAPGAEVMAFDSPDLSTDLAVTYCSTEAYCARLHRLLDDDSERDRLGEATTTRIAATHTGEAWQQRLETVYARALNAPRPTFQAPLRATTTADLLLASLNLSSGRCRTAEQVWSEHVQLLSLGPRVRAVARGRTQGLRQGHLLSDWLGGQYERYTQKGRAAVSG